MQRKKNPMKAVYSPVNQAWMVLFKSGRSQPTVIDIDGQRFWQTKKDLKWQLSLQGLKMDSKNNIKADGPNPFEKKKRNPKRRRNSSIEQRIDLFNKYLQFAQKHGIGVLVGADEDYVTIPFGTAVDIKDFVSVNSKGIATLKYRSFWTNLGRLRSKAKIVTHKYNLNDPNEVKELRSDLTGLIQGIKRFGRDLGIQIYNKGNEVFTKSNPKRRRKNKKLKFKVGDYVEFTRNHIRVLGGIMADTPRYGEVIEAKKIGKMEYVRVEWDTGEVQLVNASNLKFYSGRKKMKRNKRRKNPHGEVYFNMHHIDEIRPLKSGGASLWKWAVSETGHGKMVKVGELTKDQFAEYEGNSIFGPDHKERGRYQRGNWHTNPRRRRNAKRVYKGFEIIKVGTHKGSNVYEMRDVNTGSKIKMKGGGKAYSIAQAKDMINGFLFGLRLHGTPYRRNARMSEYGKQDAAQGLPPSKVGRRNKEYMDAYRKEKEKKKSNPRRRRNAKSQHQALGAHMAFGPSGLQTMQALVRNPPKKLTIAKARDLLDMIGYDVSLIITEASLEDAMYDEGYSKKGRHFHRTHKPTRWSMQ